MTEMSRLVAGNQGLCDKRVFFATRSTQLIHQFAHRLLHLLPVLLRLLELVAPCVTTRTTAVFPSLLKWLTTPVRSSLPLSPRYCGAGPVGRGWGPARQFSRNCRTASQFGQFCRVIPAIPQLWHHSLAGRVGQVAAECPILPQA